MELGGGSEPGQKGPRRQSRRAGEAGRFPEAEAEGLGAAWMASPPGPEVRKARRAKNQRGILRIGAFEEEVPGT